MIQLYGFLQIAVKKEQLHQKRNAKEVGSLYIRQHETSAFHGAINHPSASAISSVRRLSFPLRCDNIERYVVGFDEARDDVKVYAVDSAPTNQPRFGSVGGTRRGNWECENKGKDVVGWIRRFIVLNLRRS